MYTVHYRKEINMTKLKLALYGLSLTLLGFITGALLVIGFNSADYVISVNVMKPLKVMDIAEVSHD